MIDELSGRFFGERPSNTRLVQIWMSKQRPADKWLPEAWHMLAKGLYLGMLRDAAKIAGIGIRSSPPRKVQKTSPAANSLVRNDSDDEGDGPTSSWSRTFGLDFDTVTDEADRWAKLDRVTIREFRDDTGIVNEFALMYARRHLTSSHNQLSWLL